MLVSAFANAGGCSRERASAANIAPKPSGLLMVSTLQRQGNHHLNHIDY